jgi:hypothetical protein
LAAAAVVVAAAAAAVVVAAAAVPAPVVAAAAAQVADSKNTPQRLIQIPRKGTQPSGFAMRIS